MTELTVASLVCEVHGPMAFRLEKEQWVCRGFDGEGTCTLAGHPVPAEAAERLIAGLTRWPGVAVVRR